MTKLIFFVDDDKMMLNLMEYTFKCREGYQVRSFFSGESCIENLSDKPDIIVLDYHLGEEEDNIMSGYETLIEIKKLNIDTTVIILSRDKDKETINKFLEQGAKKYVTKDDFFIDTLIETVENHFSNKLPD